MAIQILQAHHASQYRELMLEAYELAADAFTSTAEERAAEPEAFWTKRITELEKSVVFGAFEGQRLVGTVSLEFSTRRKTRHKCHLVGMYVRQSARAAGTGRALMDAAIDYAKSQSENRILILTVTDGNVAATNLYRTAGFSEFGLEPLAIRTSEGFKAKIHMWLDLRPEG